MTWYKVAKEGSMNNGDLFKSKIGDKEILIIRQNDRFYATSLYCTHENYDLSEGFLDGGNIICPNHFATFSPTDGSVVSPPESAGEIPALKSYHVKVENGDVLVEIA
ncbi:MAG: Rieske (2Fe-2S) protein [Thermoplasmataceae archaeon]